MSGNNINDLNKNQLLGLIRDYDKYQLEKNSINHFFKERQCIPNYVNILGGIVDFHKSQKVEDIVNTDIKETVNEIITDIRVVLEENNIILWDDDRECEVSMDFIQDDLFAPIYEEVESYHNRVVDGFVNIIKTTTENCIDEFNNNMKEGI